VFPAPGNKDIEIDYIYSVDWAPDGRHIAFSYMDKKDRKIAIFDTTSRTCEVLCDTKRDERDPTYSPDSKRIYFSSDRTGIFNVYCYHFETGSLEQITNVSGGAFAPSISPDGLKMVYAGFDKNGYSIYLLDSIKALSSLKIDTAFTSVIKSEHIAVSNSGTAEPAARFPSQFLIMPAFITEQVNTARNDVNRGSSTMKAGIIVNVIEPLTLSDMGSELGGYLFIEPSRILNFDKKSFIFGPKATYDVGLFGATQRLPVGLSADYGLRGIADNDEFYNETEDSVETLPYQARIQNLNFQLSHYLVGNPNSLSSFGFSVNLIGGFNRYDISLLLMDQTVEFTYNLNKGFHAGAMAAFNTVKREMKSSISPCGIVAKLQYDFNQQHSLKEDNSFSGNTQREQYDDYRFHQVRGHTKLGIPAPWAKKTDIHFDLQGAAIKVIQQDKQFPSFLKPIAWIPGYSYYYRDIKIKDINGKDTTRIQYDTVQITGNAVMIGEISYRFPLSPRLIDKKLWIFYLERLYGAINVSGGAGFDDPKDFLDFEKEDWIMSYGLEARLEAQTFSSMPLAIKFRWDNGIDRKAPLGGHRFSLSIGYEFDNWGYILSPDYRNKMVM
jgi:hypothetical protein